MPTFSAKVEELELAFETSPQLFSPRNVDRGTAAMLRQANIEPKDKVLDLGCGYGFVGVFAAHRADPRNV